MADVTWSTRALNDLNHIAAYIKMFDPEAAMQTRKRLEALGNRLGHFHDRGRPASRGTREMVKISPYILRYRVIRGDVLILGIRHSVRRPIDRP